MAYYADTITLDSAQHAALLRFNSEIYMAGSGCAESIDHARTRAIRMLKPETLDNLVGAFMVLWPHWFTNGRSELAQGDHNQKQALCIDIIRKISAGCGVSITSGMAWLGRMGGMRLTSGRKRTAIPDEGYGVGRGVRGAKMCDIHPDKKSIGMGMCSRCYGRNRRLITMGYDTEEFSEKMFGDLMRMEAPKRSFSKEAVKFIEKHDRKVLHGG